MPRLSQEELLKKIRGIEIRTRSLSHQIFAGEYHSAFKGRGMAFSEVREYRWGDDVRSMDWNVTARMSAPYVKIFEEERELTVMLMVDISRSGLFGTAARTKRDAIAEIAAVLAFSAIINNDKVGALLFTDKVELFIPPAKGRSHLLHIIREILEFEPASSAQKKIIFSENTEKTNFSSSHFLRHPSHATEGRGTDISGALRFLTGAIKKRCNVFLLSDLMDTDDEGNPAYEEALKVAVGKHDISVIRVYDRRERSIPDVGIVHIKDSETGKGEWVDTGSRKVRSAYENWMRNSEEASGKLLLRHNVDKVDIATDEDYVLGLKTLFRRR